MAVAVGLSRHAVLHPPGHGPAASRPAGGARSTAGDSGGRPRGAARQAGDASYLPPFVRYASARGWTRHPHRPGALGTQRREHDDDLSPRAQPWAIGRDEPRRPRPGPVTATSGCGTDGRIYRPVYLGIAPVTFWPSGRGVGAICVYSGAIGPRYAARYAARRGYAGLWN